MPKTFITENLRLDSLDKEFHLDEFEAALNDGTIKTRIIVCANELHDGDVMTVLRAINKCVDSKRCNLKKSQQSKSIIEAKARMEMFKNYLTSLYPEYNGKAVSHSNGGSKPYYSLTLEEIAATSLDDIKTLQSAYDCMASLKSKYPERIEDMEEFETRRVAIRDRLKMAKDKAKGIPVAEDQPVTELSEDLLAKLTTTKSTTLSKTQVEELRKILNLK